MGECIVGGIGGNAKVELGTYQGNGLFGAANPTVIHTQGKPQVVLINATRYASNGSILHNMSPPVSGARRSKHICRNGGG